MNRAVSNVLCSSGCSRGRACTRLPSNNTSPAASSAPAARGSASGHQYKSPLRKLNHFEGSMTCHRAQSHIKTQHKLHKRAWITPILHNKKKIIKNKNKKKTDYRVKKTVFQLTRNSQYYGAWKLKRQNLVQSLTLKWKQSSKASD